MKWTTELPTEPGWYWFRNARLDKPTIVKVERYNKKLGAIIYHGLTRGCAYFITVHDDTGEWAGPIEEPTND